MGTFDLKIKMARALKVYGKETNDNLVLLRTIRNAFAHAPSPITFETTEIKSLCKFLVIPFVLFPKSVKVIDGKVVDLDEPTEPRARFNRTCESLTHNFLIFGGHCSQKREEPRGVAEVRCVADASTVAMTRRVVRATPGQPPSPCVGSIWPALAATPNERTMAAALANRRVLPTAAHHRQDVPKRKARSRTRPPYPA